MAKAKSEQSLFAALKRCATQKRAFAGAPESRLLRHLEPRICCDTQRRAFAAPAKNECLQQSECFKDRNSTEQVEHGAFDFRPGGGMGIDEFVVAGS
jgi:hypothetical protein